MKGGIFRCFCQFANGEAQEIHGLQDADVANIGGTGRRGYLRGAKASDDLGVAAFRTEEARGGGLGAEVIVGKRGAGNSIRRGAAASKKQQSHAGGDQQWDEFWSWQNDPGDAFHEGR